MAASHGHYFDESETEALLEWSRNHSGDQNEVGFTLEEAYGKWQSLKETEDISQEEKDAASASVSKAYRHLVRLTYPVTGRTILDTRSYNKSATSSSLAVTTLVILLMLIIDHFTENWVQNHPDPPAHSFSALMLSLEMNILKVVTPFLWGALGSCVYLLKKVSNLRSQKTFQKAKFQGWSSRILLGAVLGGIFTLIYDSSSLEAGMGIGFPSIGLAFLVGVGVKVFYGVIEQSILAIAKKIGADSGLSGNTALSFLMDELESTDPVNHPERQRVIKELIAKAGS